MPSFWNKVFLDNPLGDYIILIAALAGVFLVRHYLARFLVAIFHSTVRRWAPHIGRPNFLVLLGRPLEFFLLVVILITASDHLNFPTELNIRIFHSSLESLLSVGLTILFILAVFWILLRLVDFMSLVIGERAQLAHPTDSQVILFFRDFFKGVVGIIGLVIILRVIIGHDAVDKIVGALGIGAAAIALAAKESIENLIASFIILFDKPFRVGDYVQVSTASGNVEKIGLRSTRIRTDQKTYLTVPNKQMVDNILDNQTLRTQRYTEIRVEIAPQSAADTLLELCGAIGALLDDNKEVEKNFTVNLVDITRTAYVLKLTYFTQIIDWNAYLALKQRIILEIIRLMESRQVKLARAIDLPLT